MRVLSIYYKHKPGGFCKRLYRLLNGMVDSGFEVHLLSLDPPHPTLSNKISFHKIPLPIGSRDGLLFWALFTFWTPIYLTFFCLRNSFDRAVVFGAYYSAMFSIAALIRPFKTILFVRSLVFEIDKINKRPKLLRALSNVIDRIGLLRADKIVFMTETMKRGAEHFLGRSISKTAILPNEIVTKQSNRSEIDIKDLLKLREDVKDPLVLLTSGVIDDRKNIPLLISLMKLLEKERPSKTILLIAGDGPKLELLKELVDSYHLTNVVFLGWVEDLNRYYPITDIVLHPSLHEGISNSLLEAIGAGIPALASDIPEHREILKDPELLFSTENPTVLLEKVKSIIDNKEKLKELMEITVYRTSSLHFNWEKEAISYIVSE